MNTKQIEKEIEEIKQETHNYPIKFTWKQLWVVIVTFIGIISTSFGAGAKVQIEVQKVESLKQQREFQTQINSLNDTILEQKRINKETQEELTYFKNKFNTTSERLKQAEEYISEIERYYRK